MRLVAEDPGDRAPPASPGALGGEQVVESRARDVRGQDPVARVPQGGRSPRQRLPRLDHRAGGTGSRPWPARTWGCRVDGASGTGRPPRRRPRRRHGSRCPRCPGRTLVGEHGPAGAVGRASTVGERAGSTSRQTATTPCGVRCRPARRTSVARPRAAPRPTAGRRDHLVRDERPSPRRRTPRRPPGAPRPPAPPAGPRRGTGRVRARRRAPGQPPSAAAPGRTGRRRRISRSGRPGRPDARAAVAGGAQAADAAGQRPGSAGSAALAVSTSEANAASSFTASSASMRRSTSTPAAFRPWMNRL